MNAKTIASLVKKAGKKAEVNKDERSHRFYYRVNLGHKVLMWAVHELDLDHAEAVTVGNDSYSHDLLKVKQVKQVLGLI